VSDDHLEERLRAAFEDAGPSEATAARARRAAVAAVAAAPRHSRPAPRSTRRTFALVAAALAIAGGGAAPAAVMLTTGAKPAIPATALGRAGLEESGVLAGAPWLFQRAGAPLIQTVRRRPSLRFAPGTSYREALSALVRSVVADGALPRGASVAPPLPRGAVWAPGRSGPRLDLTAPSGYTVPEGAISVPSFVIAGDVSPSEAEAIVQAVRNGTPVGRSAAAKIGVEVPVLKPCQRLPRAKACRLDPAPRPRAPAGS